MLIIKGRDVEITTRWGFSGFGNIWVVGDLIKYEDLLRIMPHINHLIDNHVYVNEFLIQSMKGCQLKTSHH